MRTKYKLIKLIIISLILILFSSCGLLFMKKTKFSLFSKESLNQLLYGWGAYYNSNSINQILIDKTISSMNEGEEIEIKIHLSNFVGNGKINFKSDNASLLFNNSPIANIQFTPENYSTTQKIILLASEDDNAINEKSIIEISGEGYPTVKIPIEIKDNDSQQILIYNSASILDEGKSSEFRIRLNAKPAGNATVTFFSSDETSLNTPNSVNFTTTNFNTEQKVTLTSPEDSDSTSESTIISASMIGATDASFLVKIVDNDIKPIFNLSSLQLNEGTSATVTVQLNGEPGKDTDVILNSSNIQSVTINPSKVTFNSSNWNTPQTITLTGVQDANYDNETLALTAAITPIVSSSISITAIDDEVQSVIFTGINQLLEGNSGVVNISLAIPPAFNTTVNLSVNSSIVQINPSSFTFTPLNYSVPKQITITAISNDGNETAETISLKASANSIVDVSRNILVIDKDTKILFANFTIPLTEGSSGTMQVKLSGDPGVPNSVTLNSSWNLVTLGNTTLSFDSTNWNTYQIVTINALSDTNFTVDQSTISGTGTNLVAANYTLEVRDSGVGMLNGTVAYYPFNGNSKDESGYGNHGTPNGATLTTNRYGYKDRAYSFDGVDDWIRVFNSSSLNPSSVTVSAWISVADFSSTKSGGNGGNQYIIFKQNDWGNCFEGYDLGMWDGSRQIRTYVAPGGGSCNFSNTSTSINYLNLSDWYYISMSADNGVLKLYANGILANSTTYGFPLNYGSKPLAIGSSTDAFQGYFNGKIDDIRIHNRALSDTEVLALYNDTTEVRPNCNQILADGLSVGDGVYTIDPDGSGSGVPFQVYCDMTTDGGGWTLALKVDGNQQTFVYDASYWTTNNIYPLGAVTPDISFTEYKSQSFNTLSFSELLLRMNTSGTIHDQKFTISNTSLLQLFQGGFVTTNIGRAAWKNMVPNSSLQYNCNREGVNNPYPWLALRIGIVSNENGDCNSNDSAIGIGMNTNEAAKGTVPSVGNFADNFIADNGYKWISSFAYIFIR